MTVGHPVDLAGGPGPVAQLRVRVIGVGPDDGDCPGNKRDRLPIRAGHQGLAGKHFLSRETWPTALHAGADVAANGALTTFWSAGIAVPEQISIVGYDNTFTSSLDPISLTTVDRSGFTLGTTAGRLLVERIEGRKKPSLRW